MTRFRTPIRTASARKARSPGGDRMQRPEVAAELLSPLKDKVLLEPDVPKMHGLLHLPEAGIQRTGQQWRRGRVVAVGPGRVTEEGARIPCDVVPWDVVFYGQFAGEEVILSDETFLLMDEHMILAREE